VAEGQDDRLVALLERQIEATDRVNHAVRAIVIPSLILLVAILLASPLLLVGFFVDGFDGVLFLAGIILLVGAIWAIGSQINESALSAIPSGIALYPKEHNKPHKPREDRDFGWWAALVGAVLLGGFVITMVVLAAI